MNNASMRIGVLHFSHETVTFLKNDTTLEDFVYPGSPAKGEALLKFDPTSYMGGRSCWSSRPSRFSGRFAWTNSL
jgi:hypothetical protein